MNANLPLVKMNASRAGEKRSQRGLGPTSLNSGAWIIAVCLFMAVVWCYWATIEGLVQEWQKDPNYSVGMLVFPAALYMLWQERRTLMGCEIRPCWWGMGLLFSAQLLRVYGLLFLYESAERYALVLTVMGVVMLVCGKTLFVRTWWIQVFLFLMVPLPGRFHNLISDPLQSLATVGATFTLELMGVAVIREGHVLVLDGRVPMAVAEACSGLRMLTAFVVVGSLLAFMVSRPKWQKLILIIATVPVAILCNWIRLDATALLFLVVSHDAAETFFHDFAGFTMMPLAVALLFALLWLMNRMVIQDVASVGSSGPKAS